MTAEPTPLEYAYELANAPTPPAARDVPAVVPVGADVLAYLGLDPNTVEAQALVLVCRRYRLDPLLGHVEILERGRGREVYITRDGYLENAHRHPMFDGMVPDEVRRNSTADGWTAYVTVWRKDMGHPFRMGAQCKDTEAQAKQGNGVEMAIARAERRTLKRAFKLVAYDDDDDLEARGAASPPEPSQVAVPAATPRRQQRTNGQLERIRTLLLEHGIDDDAEAAVHMTRIVDRPVGPGEPSLTRGEADRIIADLEQALDQ
jgi:hypothetical protein